MFPLQYHLISFWGHPKVWSQTLKQYASCLCFALLSSPLNSAKSASYLFLPSRVFLSIFPNIVWFFAVVAGGSWWMPRVSTSVFVSSLCRRSWRQSPTTPMCRWRRRSACEHWGRWAAVWRSTRMSLPAATSAQAWRWSAWRQFTWRRAAWRTPTSCTPSSSRETHRTPHSNMK